MSQMRDDVQKDNLAQSNLHPTVEKTKGFRETSGVAPGMRQETAEQRATRREGQTDAQNEQEDKDEAAAKASGHKPGDGHEDEVPATITKDQPNDARYEKQVQEHLDKKHDDAKHRHEETEKNKPPHTK